MDAADPRLLSLLAHYSRKRRKLEKIVGIAESEQNANLASSRKSYAELVYWKGQIPGCDSREIMKQLSSLLHWWIDQPSFYQTELETAVVPLSVFSVLMIVAKGDVFTAQETLSLCTSLFQARNYETFAMLSDFLSRVTAPTFTTTESSQLLGPWAQDKYRIYIYPPAWTQLEQYLLRSRSYILLFITQSRLTIGSMSCFLVFPCSF